MSKLISSVLWRSLFLVSFVFISGCNLFSHTNIEQDEYSKNKSKATLDVDSNRGKDNVLMLMALSGGGSRSAYFSASVMLELERVIKDLNLLSEVDAISSVSGGSLPAAYYAISTDDDEPQLYGRKWNEKTVKALMKKNYILKWFGNWFWPINIGKFWATAYDRTDIMAQTLADNLFDTRPLGKDLKIGDLRQERPYLILNATNGSSEDNEFGTLFTFTDDYFNEINSDINDYELSRAVMATATFPAVFNYMTMKNFQSSHDDQSQYLHIFDGGNVDNLGLTSLEEVIDNVIKNQNEVDSIIVILVDAYTGKSGVSMANPDSRGFLDFIIDTNFIDATDSLLSTNRDSLLANFKGNLRRRLKKENFDVKSSMFYHISFDDIQDLELQENLNNISTNFSIRKKNSNYIDLAIEKIMQADNSCLTAMVEIINGRTHNEDFVCSYKN